MVALVILEGPRRGEQFPLKDSLTRLGRDPVSDIHLPSQRVSRNHAHVQCVDGDYFVEDLGSRNGTFVNNQRVNGRMALTPTDRLAVGEFTFGLILSEADASNTADVVIREEIRATFANTDLFAQNPAQALQLVLEISQELSTALEIQPLLDNLLSRLLQLFKRADRGLILLCEHERLTVRAQHSRRGGGDAEFPFSRTIVQKSLTEGLGILSEDVDKDERFNVHESVRSANVRSLMCVPLISRGGRRLGVIQLEQTGAGLPFRSDDLRLLTTLSLQVAVVLENVAVHAEKLQQEMLRKELAVARKIQQAYLPSDFDDAGRAGYQTFANIQPAREVSGDFYDFFPLPDGRLAFFVGDVSGKGIPAALFMVAVRTLARHLAPLGKSPAATLIELNAALAADNPSMMFVTLAYAIYDPASGEVVLTSGGHPPPLLLRADGTIDEVSLPTGRVLGYALGVFHLADTRLALQPGETMIFYSDGFTEACAADGVTMFELQRLRNVFLDCGERSLREAADLAQEAVRSFTGGGDIQDDQTLLFLRRVGGTNVSALTLPSGTAILAPASVHMTLTSSIAEVDVLAEHIDRFAAQHHLPAEVCGDVQLALEEIVINVIKHGYQGEPGHPIAVEMAVRNEELVICVADSAAAFNPLTVPEPDLNLPMWHKEPGGLGVHLIKRMMTRIDYERIDGKNRLTLRKKL